MEWQALVGAQVFLRSGATHAVLCAPEQQRHVVAGLPPLGHRSLLLRVQALAVALDDLEDGLLVRANQDLAAQVVQHVDALQELLRGGGGRDEVRRALRGRESRIHAHLHNILHEELEKGREQISVLAREADTLHELVIREKVLRAVLWRVASGHAVPEEALVRGALLGLDPLGLHHPPLVHLRWRVSLLGLGALLGPLRDLRLPLALPLLLSEPVSDALRPPPKPFVARPLVVFKCERKV
mmetsp:Transcript_10543/g.29784  ORF Transcript_10543/g.29784 Transcript_10543/m.29784 type:complete len:241 (-) Transcript_10543:307-1029(-)